MKNKKPGRAVLFINPKKEQALVLSKMIDRYLTGAGIETRIMRFGGDAVIKCPPADVAFSLGGDGTVLYAARLTAPAGVPLIPVNLGTLGFMASVNPDSWKAAFDAFVSGKASVSRRMMLHTTIIRGGKKIFSGVCLNDTVISSTGISKLIRLDVSYREKKGGVERGTPMGLYRSDGLIVATPTGSTAYSAAAGGPILDPSVDAVILNPVCPFTLSHRPVVVPSDGIISVEVESEQRSGVILTIDGQITVELKGNDIAEIARAKKPALLVTDGNGQSFYEALKTKLSWLEAPGGTTASKGRKNA